MGIHKDLLACQKHKEWELYATFLIPNVSQDKS